MPVSMTATITEALPVVTVWAATASMPAAELPMSYCVDVVVEVVPPTARL